MYAADLLEPEAWNDEITTAEIAAEIIKCSKNPVYFINKFCKIENPQIQKWIPFTLWPEQVKTVIDIFKNQKSIALKARQLGLSWLVLAIALWYIIFRPGSSIGLFSRRDTEAIYLLDDRLRGMVDHLPDWLRPKTGEIDNKHEWSFKNGSVVRAFPTSAGDAYTFTFAVVDEADLAPDLQQMLLAVEPTISQNGKLVLISKVNKSKPQSAFKRIYRAAKARTNDWKAIFLPWYIRRERTKEWYLAKCKDALKLEGTLDSVKENYPTTDLEALEPKQLDKRFAPQHIKLIYKPKDALPQSRVPASMRLPGLNIYELPQEGKKYVIGSDVAEGNPNSDFSSFHIIDVETWKEIGHYSARVEPETLARNIDKIGMAYNKADVFVERNNHGHAAILWLRQNSYLFLIKDEDGKPGFLTTTKSKTLMFTKAATIFSESGVEVYSFDTVTQLQAIEAKTLRAPDGEHDDEAMSYLIALMAATRPRASFKA